MSVKPEAKLSLLKYSLLYGESKLLQDTVNGLHNLLQEGLECMGSTASWENQQSAYAKTMCRSASR